MNFIYFISFTNKNSINTYKHSNFAFAKNICLTYYYNNSRKVKIINVIYKHSAFITYTLKHKVT